jgi:hypothetical protein
MEAGQHGDGVPFVHIEDAVGKAPQEGPPHLTMDHRVAFRQAADQID